MAEDKRDQIVRAMHRCIREKGYAGTSLTDIAVAAGMSPSHIRYYFDGKDAILEDFFAKHCNTVVDGVKSIEREDLAKWFDSYVEYYIANPQIRPANLSVIVEIFGLSVHQPRLRAIKTAYNAAMTGVLIDFFECAGHAREEAERAAAILNAFELGLKFDAAFREGYDPGAARAAFVEVTETLLGRPITKLEAKRAQANADGGARASRKSRTPSR
jgi:AcrR family transcriptional regulator